MISGKIVNVVGISLEGGCSYLFTYNEFREKSNEFVELIADVFYRPSKEIINDYDI